MDIVIKKLGSRGEVVIPEEMRRELGLKKDSLVEFIRTKNAIIILPAKKKFKDMIGLFGEGVKNPGELDLIAEELMADV